MLEKRTVHYYATSGQIQKIYHKSLKMRTLKTDLKQANNAYSSRNVIFGDDTRNDRIHDRGLVQFGFFDVIDLLNEIVISNCL